MRDKKNEGSAPNKIYLEIDRDEAFDYEECVSKNSAYKIIRTLSRKWYKKLESNEKSILGSTSNNDPHLTYIELIVRKVKILLFNNSWL